MTIKNVLSADDLLQIKRALSQVAIPYYSAPMLQDRFGDDEFLILNIALSMFTRSLLASTPLENSLLTPKETIDLCNFLSEDPQGVNSELSLKLASLCDLATLFDTCTEEDDLKVGFDELRELESEPTPKVSDFIEKGERFMVRIAKLLLLHQIRRPHDPTSLEVFLPFLKTPFNSVNQVQLSFISDEDDLFAKSSTTEDFSLGWQKIQELSSRRRSRSWSGSDSGESEHIQSTSDDASCASQTDLVPSALEAYLSWSDVYLVFAPIFGVGFAVLKLVSIGTICYKVANWVLKKLHL